MKQVVQSLKTGKVSLEDVPRPILRAEGILVRSRYSLISAGTERAALELGQKSLVGMARERPDLVRRVLDKLRRDGFWNTFTSVRDQLDREVPLGYSICGDVIECGADVDSIQLGQLVACAGAGHASHAEINYVPKLLSVKVPDGVAASAAAYATVGAIALHGARNADIQVGETVAVIGLGLIGQLSVQILRAAGCRAIGIDLSAVRVRLAKDHGAELAFESQQDDFEDAIRRHTRGRGVDAVLITAATKSNAPVELAARLARDRARVVMVGVTGMDIPRRDYYHKELTFIVSRSYGPGRYDAEYEEHGRDYPVGQVRWTENRNMEAFLDLVAGGQVKPEVCTTHTFSIVDAVDAYDLILTNREPHLGVLLEYPRVVEPVAESTIRLADHRPAVAKSVVGVSSIGAGSFARAVLLPNLKKASQVRLRGVMTSSGLTAKSVGKRFQFDYCSSSIDDILSDAETDAVLVLTRHSQHADLVCRSLLANKAVFAEKPLAIDLPQLRGVCAALDQSRGNLMVGFNRRFAQFAVDMQAHFRDCGPLAIHYRCNAGKLPREHWLSDPREGGRIIGEACHFFDFFGFMTNADPKDVFAAAVGGQDDPDNLMVTVNYSDGSRGQLVYATDGSPRGGKERVEVFGGGRTAILDDFRSLELHGPRGRTMRRQRFSRDKGHGAELTSFLAAVRSRTEMPISSRSLILTSLTSFAAVRSARLGQPVEIASLQNELHS